MHITISHNVPYTGDASTAQLLDIYKPDNPSPTPTVLLWHGSGTNEKHVLAPLARTAAGLGATIVVPDWRPEAADRGKNDLLASLRYVREHASHFAGSSNTIVLAGWSAGAGAAVALALDHHACNGWQPSAAVGIAGRYDVPSRTTGTAPLTSVSKASPLPSVPIRLIHGSADTIVPSSHSTDLLNALHHAGHTANYVALPTDHAGVVMTEYDPTANTCVPARSPQAQDAGRRTAHILLETAAAAAA
ncbi:alpha/beta hydrolase fold domain-containing protein [Streptomyces sp. NPDC046197]|uniref:alpha/beta hydrolase family protein n=1 Tax=Streptomyces sp. NPDC046197 TaxID=3154337 RepID=UPI0033F4876A